MISDICNMMKGRSNSLGICVIEFIVVVLVIVAIVCLCYYPRYRYLMEQAIAEKEFESLETIHRAIIYYFARGQSFAGLNNRALLAGAVIPVNMRGRAPENIKNEWTDDGYRVRAIDSEEMFSITINQVPIQYCVGIPALVHERNINFERLLINGKAVDTFGDIQEACKEEKNTLTFTGRAL